MTLLKLLSLLSNVKSARASCSYFTDFEKRLNRKLASDDFDDIAEAITPKNLGLCAKNALLKAFEVGDFK